jgi:glycosyltransferase involved in cell wall biosynthesis
MKRVTVITHSPSPYQVELFDEVAGQGGIDLTVVYLHDRDPQREWGGRAIAHHHMYFTRQETRAASLLPLLDGADLVVVNYYKHPLAGTAIRRRVSSGKAVTFWGERPLPQALPWLARLARRWRLRALHQIHAPIWGIGSMAVEAYRQEFGTGHCYVNLPYFSDLQRFAEATGNTDGNGCVFLYSGSLSHRKGVDLLARAFATLAGEVPGARLRIVGSGPLEGLMKQQLAACLDRVEFTGFRDWNDLPAEYGRAHVLCAPSRHDGWGLVVPEGLAAGLPVISTTQTGAAVEFITEGVNGWLVQPSLQEDLIRSMKTAAAMSIAERQKMAQSARASVAEHTLKRGGERFTQAALAAMRN